MTHADTDRTGHRAVVLDESEPAHVQTLARLRADSGIEFLDPLPAGGGTPTRWVYYAWRRAVVRVPEPGLFRRERLDRNRNLVTLDEIATLGTLRIGVVGLSVGHAIAHTLAAEGLCGALRLADFDELELSNLNRVPATVFDLGVNKAVACARRIAELDPYLPVEVVTEGVTADTVDAFLDGVDIVVEECDSLDIKVLVRQAARAQKVPVLMATSSGGLLDVERFDLEPDRPVFHGLLGDVDAATLARLSSKDKVPHVLRVIDATALRPRMQASLIEVGTSLTTWPQLSSEVAIGAATVAEAVRRIGLGEDLGSGRVRVDVPALLDDVHDPSPPPGDRGDATLSAAAADDPAPRAPGAAGTDAMTAIAAAAVRAPSGGNTQPWQVEVGDTTLTVRLDTDLTSTMDVGYRASAVAVGAATFNARVAASAHGLRADVTFETFEQGPQGPPLTATVRTAPGQEPELARLYDGMLRRETNRHTGERAEIDDETVDALTRVAESEGARLHLVTGTEDIRRIASVLGDADRIRYLTPALHAEMIRELRWPGDPDPHTGIDIATLELDPADTVFLDILRSGPVMAHLAAWGAGSALGDTTRGAVASASAVAAVTVRGDTLADYARGGAAMEAVWVRAQEHGLAVQPISPAFLYARDRRELDALSPAFTQRLADLQYSLQASIGVDSDESLILILRVFRGPRPSAPSRRRKIPGRSTPT